MTGINWLIDRVVLHFSLLHLLLLLSVICLFVIILMITADLLLEVDYLELDKYLRGAISVKMLD